MTLNKGDMVGYLLLKERFKKDNGRAYWHTHCTLCDNDKDIREDSLQSGKIVSCGCYLKSKERSEKAKEQHPIEDLTGNVYGDLTVLGLANHRNGKQILWTCLCTCGETCDVWSANLKNGNSKTCGAPIHRTKALEKAWSTTFNDLSGQVFDNWKVLYRDGNTQPTRWIVECQECGNIKSILRSNLINGENICEVCKDAATTLVGQQFGYWEVLERGKRMRPNGHYCTNYLCRCLFCGTERFVDAGRLLNGKSLSCGCLKSKANAYISQALLSMNINFEPEYKYEDLIGPGGGLLRFDFAIKNSENNVICLIEFQGQQHYINTEFGKQQREITDIQKIDYCQQHNIPLHEIKYTEIIDEKLMEILTHHKLIPCQAS